MSNFFKSFLPYLAGAAGSGISSQFSALAPFSAAIGAGAGALSDLKNPLGGAAAGFAGGGVGSTLAGGLKGAFTGTSGSALDNFGSGAMSGLQSFGNSIPGFGGVGTSNPTGAFAKFFTPTSGNSGGNGINLSGANNYAMSPAGGSVGANFGGGGTPPPSGGGVFPASGGNTGLGFNLGSLGDQGLSTSTPSSSITSSSPASSLNPMGMFKSLVPGAAVSLLGSAFAPKVAAPDYSGIQAQLQSQIQNGADPAARQAAENQYLATLAQPDGASAEGAVANAALINDRQKAQAVKDLQAQFSANNGSLTGNSAYNDALAKTNAQYDQNYAATAQQAQYQADQLQAQQKTAAANALAGMDATQLQYYAGLANLSVEQIQEKTGMDVASSNSIKQIAATAGQLLMEKGLGLNGGVK